MAVVLEARERICVRCSEPGRLAVAVLVVYRCTSGSRTDPTDERRLPPVTCAVFAFFSLDFVVELQHSKLFLVVPHPASPRVR